MRDGLAMEHPGFKLQQVVENSKKPARDIEVVISRTDEFRNVAWSFDVE